MEGENAVKTKIEEILEQAEANQSFEGKSTKVSKECEPEFDVGNLLLIDQQPLRPTELSSKKSHYLNELARDNAQLLFNEIWKLPVNRFEDAILVQLPEPKTVLPREKKIPKPKPPTKWEIFAKKKGIQSKKRERMLWDEEAKEWKPRYGYKRTGDVNDKWLIELPDQADAKEDQFEKLNKEKKERVAKNELQRLRNIAKNKSGRNKVISTEFKPEARKTQERLGKEIDIAKTSTASIGKFQQKLPKETEKRRGIKRKFESVVGNPSSEKEKTLDIWNKVHNPSIVDSNKGAKKLITESQRDVSKKGSKKRGVGSRVKNRVMKPKKGKAIASRQKTSAKKKSGGRNKSR
eukprot:gene9144-10117_t